MPPSAPGAMPGEVFVVPAAGAEDEGRPPDCPPGCVPGCAPGCTPGWAPGWVRRAESPPPSSKGVTTSPRFAATAITGTAISARTRHQRAILNDPGRNKLGRNGLERKKKRIMGISPRPVIRPGIERSNSNQGISARAKPDSPGMVELRFAAGMAPYAGKAERCEKHGGFSAGIPAGRCLRHYNTSGMAR